MKLYSTFDHKKLIYFDIETVPMVRDFEMLDERMQGLWKKRAMRMDSKIDESEDWDKNWKANAALVPEFSIIVAIVVGYFDSDDKFQIETFSWNNKIVAKPNASRPYREAPEAKLLQDFRNCINKIEFNGRSMIGHNALNFDYPFILRRCMINGIAPPDKLCIYGKKPWEMDNLLDSVNVWKCGLGGYTSLDVLCAHFGVESPKIIDGALTWHYFYDKSAKEGIDQISLYCGKEVKALAKVICRIKMDDIADTIVV